MVWFVPKTGEVFVRRTSDKNYPAKHLPSIAWTEVRTSPHPPPRHTTPHHTPLSPQSLLLNTCVQWRYELTCAVVHEPPRRDGTLYAADWFRSRVYAEPTTASSAHHSEDVDAYSIAYPQLLFTCEDGAAARLLPGAFLFAVELAAVAPSGRRHPVRRVAAGHVDLSRRLAEDPSGLVRLDGCVNASVRAGGARSWKTLGRVGKHKHDCPLTVKPAFLQLDRLEVVAALCAGSKGVGGGGGGSGSEEAAEAEPWLHLPEATRRDGLQKPPKVLPEMEDETAEETAVDGCVRATDVAAKGCENKSNNNNNNGASTSASASASAAAGEQAGDTVIDEIPICDLSIMDLVAIETHHKKEAEAEAETEAELNGEGDEDEYVVVPSPSPSLSPLPSPSPSPQRDAGEVDGEEPEEAAPFHGSFDVSGGGGGGGGGGDAADDDDAASSASSYTRKMHSWHEAQAASPLHAADEDSGSVVVGRRRSSAIFEGAPPGLGAAVAAADAAAAAVSADDDEDEALPSLHTPPQHPPRQSSCPPPPPLFDAAADAAAAAASAAAAAAAAVSAEAAELELEEWCGHLDAPPLLAAAAEGCGHYAWGFEDKRGSDDSGGGKKTLPAMLFPGPLALLHRGAYSKRLFIVKGAFLFFFDSAAPRARSRACVLLRGAVLEARERGSSPRFALEIAPSVMPDRACALSAYDPSARCFTVAFSKEEEREGLRKALALVGAR